MTSSSFHAAGGGYPSGTWLCESGCEEGLADEHGGASLGTRWDDRL